MSGKYGSKDITVSLDDAPGGTLRVITNHVMEMGGIAIESDMELSAAFGDVYDEHTPSGRKRIPEITIGGFWDTTATTGPHAVMQDPDDDPNDATRTLTVVVGDSKTMTVEGRLRRYEVLGTDGKLTKFAAIFLPSGSGVWT